MSNALAISAVTATLRNLILRGTHIPNDNVTTKPLDKARSPSSTPDQLNLFLYQTILNAAWRNMDVPRQTQPGESGQPPLALNLYYLLTAYGQGDDDAQGHKWLGKAMLTLHDHPLLGAQEVKDALADSELNLQLERVRITPQPLSLDEMSKLWTTFQTQYRISAAYEVQVVLIESTRARRTPLPVLTRGEKDDGVRASPDLVPPFPTIVTVQPANQQPSARVAEQLTIQGFHLDGDSVAVRFTSSRLGTPLTKDATGTTDRVVVPVPDVPAGLCTVAVCIRKVGEPDRFTNEWPLQIAPVITHLDQQAQPGGDVTLTVTCSPEVRPEQSVSLLIGERDVPAAPHPSSTPKPTFIAKGGLASGEYFVRLRVDGVDSLLVDRQAKPPSFDASQKVTIP